MKIITRVADEYAKFARWVAIISGAAVLILMLYTVVDVTGRYLANRPVPAAYEMTIIFLIYICYFGITLVQARKGQMRLEFLYDKSGYRGKLIIDLFSVLFGLFIFGIVTWKGWEYAVESWQVKEVTLGAYTVPVFPGRIGLAIGATIFVIQYIIDLTVILAKMITSFTNKVALKSDKPEALVSTENTGGIQ
jgi:TRAP-type C4-dicarboxylate transport system permease small subunit